jgi:hypothetical protein
MARFIRKSDGSGRLAGSIGSGRDTVPSAAAHAPAGAGATVRPAASLGPVVDEFRVGPRARRGQLAGALWSAGLTEPQQLEVLGYVDRRLDGDGMFAVHTDASIPTPAAAADALRHGHVDVYEALCDGIDAASRSAHADAACGPVAAAYPAAAGPVRAFLDAVAVTRTPHSRLGMVDPVAGDGPLSWQGHAFAARVGDDFRIRPGLPATVADVRGLLERTRDDAVIRTFDDLVTATYLRGPVALSSGRWEVDRPAVAAGIVSASFEMEEESAYQALALAYSGGRSQDSGFDADWAPAPGASRAEVPDAVREWLLASGRHDDGFGAWACRRVTVPHVRRRDPVPPHRTGRRMAAGETDLPARDAGR